MTMKEIEQRFDKEWVLIKDPVRSRNQKLQKGRVLCHGKDRDEMYDKIADFGPMHFAVMYVGKRPEGVVYIL